MLRVLPLLLVTVLLARAQAPVTISLKDAAGRVIDANPLVLAAHQDVLSSEKQLSRAWREFVPTITANARYSYLDDDIALVGEPDHAAAASGRHHDQRPRRCTCWTAPRSARM